MPSSSVPGAVCEYISGLTVPTVGAVPAFRDRAQAKTAGGSVLPPYVVVRQDGGSPLRDLEGNVFGPKGVVVTVYADTAAVARAVGDFIRFGGQPPDQRAGIEADGALPLTGYTQVQAWLTDEPVEEQSATRRSDVFQNTYRFRLQVHAQKG